MVESIPVESMGIVGKKHLTENEIKSDHFKILITEFCHKNTIAYYSATVFNKIMIRNDSTV